MTAVVSVAFAVFNSDEIIPLRGLAPRAHTAGRGWTVEQLAAGEHRLRSRGLLDADGLWIAAMPRRRARSVVVRDHAVDDRGEEIVVNGGVDGGVLIACSGADGGPPARRPAQMSVTA